MDLLSPEGLRMDGRRPAECRQTSISFSQTPRGVTFKSGHSCVQAIISDSKGFQVLMDSKDRKSIEMAALIKKTLETLLIGSKDVAISLWVLESDGSILATALNAATLALIESGIPMSDYAISLSVGYLNGPLVDLNDVEERDIPGLQLTLTPRDSVLVMANMESRLSLDHFETLLNAGRDAANGVFAIMESAILNHLDEHSINR